MHTFTRNSADIALWTDYPISSFKIYENLIIVFTMLLLMDGKLEFILSRVKNGGNLSPKIRDLLLFQSSIRLLDFVARVTCKMFYIMRTTWSTHRSVVHLFSLSSFLNIMFHKDRRRLCAFPLRIWISNSRWRQIYAQLVPFLEWS